MAELSWKQEPDKLRKARHIVCEVPELLMEILEHDYGKDPEGPEDPLEIRYYHGDARHYHSSGYAMKGAAWAHLLKNPPIVVVTRKGETEHFKPVFEEKYNPYRKRHTHDYWGWCVLRWELVPPEEGDKSCGGTT